MVKLGGDVVAIAVVAERHGFDQSEGRFNLTYFELRRN